MFTIFALQTPPSRPLGDEDLRPAAAGGHGVQHEAHGAREAAHEAPRQPRRRLLRGQLEVGFGAQAAAPVEHFGPRNRGKLMKKHGKREGKR